MGSLTGKGFALLAASLAAACLGIAACGPSALPGRDGDRPGGQPGLGQGLPEVSLLADKSALVTGHEVDPSGFAESEGTTTGEFYGDPIAILTPPASDLPAWAMYSMAVPEGKVFTGINLDVDNADLEDEEWVPALPFYVGVANFADERWEWLGPYEDFMAAPRLSNELPRETYVNSAGAAWWVILSYCPPEEPPSVTIVLYLDGVYDDAQQ